MGDEREEYLLLPEAAAAGEGRAGRSGKKW